MDPSQRDRDSAATDRASPEKQSQALIACDACHSRKVRCDRQTPCGNCQDNSTQCQRVREKRRRKARKSIERELEQGVPDIQSRLTSLEQSVNQLLTCVKELVSREELPAASSESSSRKRGATEAFGRSEPAHTPRPFQSTMPKVSAHKAQMMIQHELNSVPVVLKERRSTLFSALNVLKENLNTEMVEDDVPESEPLIDSLNDALMPDTSLIQWMLQSEDSGRPVCSKQGFMPFVSRRTIARMAADVFDTPRESCDPASRICVSAYAAYFLQEIVLSKTSKTTGLESRLSVQAEELFNSARNLCSSFAQDAATSLSNLQALTFGVMLAQEVGDFFTAWSLARVTSSICIALQLNRPGKVFESIGAEIEAYYCFGLCYMNDKGLAMNLGRPSFLPDSEMEVDILAHPMSGTPGVDNYYIYLRLAKIQSQIMEDLGKSTSSGHQRQIIDGLMKNMGDIWRMKVQSDIPHPKNNSYASEMETTMVELAFFSVQTVIFQSSTETLRDPQYTQSCLEAARAALLKVQKARILSRFAQYDSKYMKASFAHWTILYYPFTPFFVLFCNVVRTNSSEDFASMHEFVAFLSELEDISDSIAKLYKLCNLFLSLTASIMRSHDDMLYPVHPLNHLHHQDEVITSGSAMPRAFEIFEPNLPTTTSSQPFNPQHKDAVIGFEQNWLAPQPGIESSLEHVQPYYMDPLYEEFMGRQPLLQWLDSDLDSFWAQSNGQVSYLTPP